MKKKKFKFTIEKSKNGNERLPFMEGTILSNDEQECKRDLTKICTILEPKDNKKLFYTFEEEGGQK